MNRSINRTGEQTRSFIPRRHYPLPGLGLDPPATSSWAVEHSSTKHMRRAAVL